MAEDGQVEQWKSLNLEFAVIGAQRGGSTFLGTLIDELSGVDLPYLELPIFEDGFYQSGDVGAVRSAWSEGTTVVRGIKRPALLATKEAPKRLSASGIKNAFLSVRDPVKRTISATYWYMYSGLISVQDPDILINRLLDGEATDERSLDLLSYSLYGHHVKNWLANFSGDLHIMTDIEIRNNPSQVHQVVSAKVGVLSSTSGKPGSTAKRNAAIYDLRRLKFLSYRNRFFKGWDRSGLDLNSSGTRIKETVCARSISIAFQGVDRLVMSRVFTESSSFVSSATLERLEHYFSEDLQLLHELAPALDMSQLVRR